MRISKRSPPLPLSTVRPTILPLVPSPEERLEQDRKPGQEGAKEGQQKEATAKGSSKPQQPNGGDPSFVAVKDEESTHLVHHQPQTQTSSSQFHPLPLNLEVNRRQPSSDLQLTIIRVKDGWICSDGGGGRGGGGEEPETSKYENVCMYSNTPSQADEGLHGEEETKGKRCPVLFNNSRNASIMDAKANDETRTNGLLSSSSNQVVERWREGEKAFPLKKRKGIFNVKVIEETTMADKKKKMRTILKTKTNKRFFPPEDNHKDDEEDEEEEEEEERKEGLTTNSSGRRSKYNSIKRRSRGVVMEGSRCSRMNGRGWRCCQPTLVGYSLCEHHLGKGRLRSMNTVRTHARASSIIPELDKPMRSLPSSSSSSISKYEEEDLLDEDEKQEDEKPLMGRMIRMKQIGMVKARSISSLLGT